MPKIIFTEHVYVGYHKTDIGPMYQVFTDSICWPDLLRDYLEKHGVDEKANGTLNLDNYYIFLVRVFMKNQFKIEHNCDNPQRLQTLILTILNQYMEDHVANS